MLGAERLQKSTVISSEILEKNFAPIKQEQNAIQKGARREQEKNCCNLKV